MSVMLVAAMVFYDSTGGCRDTPSYLIYLTDLVAKESFNWHGKLFNPEGILNATCRISSCITLPFQEGIF